MSSQGERAEFKLPEDVIMGILSKLTVKSLLRFKCVCREWRSLISSLYFASLHLKHAISNPLSQSILVHLNRPRKSVPYDLVTFSPCNNYLNLGLDQAYTFRDEVQFVGSINGLLCLSELRGRWACLWNPSTRMFRKIKTGMTKLISNSIGFGFDPIANDYKVVVFYSRDTNTEKVGNVGLKVWSAKLESWKDIKVDSNFFICGRRNICEVIVNEFTYWIFRNELAIFNMSMEVLRLVPMPCVYSEYTIFYYGFIWKGSFALATYYECPGKYQVWTIENDTHGKEYWRKIFIIGLQVPSFFLFSNKLAKWQTYTRSINSAIDSLIMT